MGWRPDVGSLSGFKVVEAVGELHVGGVSSLSKNGCRVPGQRDTFRGSIRVFKVRELVGISIF